MKIVYSELLKLLPDLKVDPYQLRDDLTLIGHFVSGVKIVEGDTILDLEIRQNRADCLGYYGIARDLSVFYQTKLIIDNQIIINYPDAPINVEIKSTDVKRLLATKISNLTISSSPRWLINLLQQHDINSINNLVDLTNYVMLIFGIPCHAFDTSKTTSRLIWENNQNRYHQFQTLDGTTLNLVTDNLIIHNDQSPLSLSFIGGNNSGIDQSTTESIIEMAVYNPTRVRSDSRGLKTITEASIRLDKYLDTDTTPAAFSFLIKLVLNYCHGQITSKLLDYYPEPLIPKPIEFDLNLPAAISGISIPPDFSLSVFKLLGCTINQSQITPPTIRKDINITEDLAEEVIRFWGYNKIPTNTPVNSSPLPDITPPILYSIEKLKDDLVFLGYDEVRSWPLDKKPEFKDTAVYTQNSINSDYPVLRQSISRSLEHQLGQYIRYKLPAPQFFEVGKIFDLIDNKYAERYSLGIYNHNPQQLLDDLKKLKLNAKVNVNFAEIALDSIAIPPNYNYSPITTDNSATELTRQIITLDANLTLSDKEDPTLLIKKYQQIIGDKILWQITITDIFHDQKQNLYRYTFRISYYNCDDKTAKRIHLSTFGLTDLLADRTVSSQPQFKETIPIYYQDMYLQSTTVTILDIITKNNVQSLVLDQTIFFPGGGGQPADMGSISHAGQSYPLASLLERNGQILHQIAPSNLRVGYQVILNLDWNYRYRHMRLHSAGHLLHETIMYFNSSLVPLKGYHQEPAYLTYQGLLDPSLKDKIELEVNHLIVNNLPIICDYTTVEELKHDSRSVPTNLPTNKKLRRLKIGQYPSMADGGVQVKNTKEIGQIIVNNIEYQNYQTKISYQIF